jgi:hypothetical protein
VLWVVRTVVQLGKHIEFEVEAVNAVRRRRDTGAQVGGKAVAVDRTRQLPRVLPPIRGSNRLIEDA